MATMFGYGLDLTYISFSKCTKTAASFSIYQFSILKY